MKITSKTTDLKIGTVLKAIHIKDDAPFKLNKFYKITDGDCIGSLEVGGYSDIEFAMNELGDYFELIDSLDDIEDLENKVWTLKETIEKTKNELKPLGLNIIEMEDKIIQRAINEIQDDEIELRFICDNMDIAMVEKCTSCGKFLMPDDVCYEDCLNDGASLCDHCSIFNDKTDMYERVNNGKDSTDYILRDSILSFIFCDEIPTYYDLKSDGKLHEDWQLSEEYQNYDYSLVMQLVDERVFEFTTHAEAVNLELEESQNLIYENKKMGDFLEKLGVTSDDITSFVINGSNEDINQMILKIKEGL